MATLKKQRQKLAIKFRKALGIDFTLAMKLAKCNIDSKYGWGMLEEQLTEVLGKPNFYKGCECCGNSRHVWNGKKGSLVGEFGHFRLV